MGAEQGKCSGPFSSQGSSSMMYHSSGGNKPTSGSQDSGLVSICGSWSWSRFTLGCSSGGPRGGLHVRGSPGGLRQLGQAALFRNWFSHYVSNTCLAHNLNPGVASDGKEVDGNVAKRVGFCRWRAVLLRGVESTFGGMGASSESICPWTQPSSSFIG